LVPTTQRASGPSWNAWAPWLIIFGPVASGLGWIAGMLILWTSPAWSRRDQLIATFVPLAGLVALFFGLVAALRGSAGCTGHADPPDADASSATLPLCLSTGRVLLRPARST
jgi:hypothetical protein